MIRILLVEDDPDHAELINAHLARRRDVPVQVSWVRRLADGLAQMTAEPTDPVDVILLDLGLPDSTIDKTLNAVLQVAKSVPVVVLSSLEDEEFAITAVHQGAQDYLCKSRINGEVLIRSVRYAIERKAAEVALRAASRTKDEFLATLSHELRTPVGIIQGYAELLSDSCLDESERRHAIETILKHSRLQVSLIEDLLDMSSIITGKLSLRCEPIDVGPIVAAAVASVRLAAESKRIKIASECGTELGLVQGDAVRLQQVMWNLLSNAIKFTQADGCIKVRLSRSQGHAVIEVADTGEGIEPAFLPYVFDRFRQQDSSLSRRVGGLGLGLAIVRYLVELHGGWAAAASPGVGKGATISVYLPLMTTTALASEATVSANSGSLNDSAATVGPSRHRV